MQLDPRTPVLIGGGQVNRRADDGEPLEPVDLIVAAARAAEADTGAPVVAAIDSVRVISMLSWRYRDPGVLVAERLGATAVRQSLYAGAGGNSPQALLNRTCVDIAAGRVDVVLIGGAEAWRTRMGFRAAGDRPTWTVQGDEVPEAEPFMAEFEMMHPAELARGVAMPVQIYPMMEQALRAAAGRSTDDHLDRISGLWSRFSEVAAGNPNAWIQKAYTPEQIRTPGPDNRMIGFPYPKLMNSNNAVEQGAALVLCSAGAAERLGVARDRWVFPLAGTDAHDTAAVSNRPDLASSPAIRVAGRRVLEMAGTGVDDLEHLDLYSCFPSAVQIAARELGLSVEDAIAGARRLTVTGGLSFAGGPWNNYVTHAVATMAARLRESANGARGLVTANGGFVTKHAVGVYGTEPPSAGFRWEDVQAEVDAITSPRDVAPEHDGPVTIEVWTVMHSRAGEPEGGFAAVLLEDGRRAWGTTRDADAVKEMLTADLAGTAAHLSPDGTLRL